MSEPSGVEVLGISGVSYEGQHVYLDNLGRRTIAEDDGVSSPFEVVEHVVYTDRAETRAISESELASWRRKRRN